ncbi:MAG: DUF512 domain-containing protein [Lachnospiraceae bacterium]|nr:DUF512 domain-containing protein [Lachnospiraceae bacterium]
MRTHTITQIETGSIAEEMEIEAGDILVSIDDREIGDIFDYRMACGQERITVLIRKGENARNGVPSEEWELEIEKDAYEDLGLVFGEGLMDRYRSCRNGCVFCFIDQMPKGMRDTLYFKDDDARLSFLQGNYITLTNMTEREVDRILAYHLSPINISFHTTNPALRCKMLRNPKAGEALKYARRLAGEGTGIELNGQIVLCRGINDGAELERTMRDLLADYTPGLKSVSVVPVGLTAHRKGLYPLKPFSPAEAKAVLAQISAFGERAMRERGTRFVFAGDEWYLLAAAGESDKDVTNAFPLAEAYEGYPQLENGVGMARLMIDECRDALRLLTDPDNSLLSKIQSYNNEISLITGELFAPVLRVLTAEAKAAAPGLTVHVYPVRNDFFGPSITVSGLLTGGDIIRQLKGKPLGSRVLLPPNVLRAGENVLLDDVTVPDIESALQIPVAVCGLSGYDLISALFDLPEGTFDGMKGDDTRAGTGTNPYELPETGG